jgi:hypothetical protein
MAVLNRIGIVSDIHYAGPAERARGNDYEISTVANPVLRLLLRIHRRFVWLRYPLEQNHLLDRFLESRLNFDYVVANGDYSCNTAFVGLSDEAARASANECIEKLRGAFDGRLQLTVGDHELGKKSFVGGLGGMRLQSWQSLRGDLRVPGFWRMDIGRYVLLGVVSSLVALPIYEPDTLSEERPEWEKLRTAHLAEIKAAFEHLKPEQKVLLFCHDPTALPFLWREDVVRARLDQIEQTIIGHLHSNFIFRLSRVAAGMPRVTLLGHTARRITRALTEARRWQPFKVRLCPSLAGIELLKDGGFLTAELDPEARQPARFVFHPVSRHA